MVLAALQYGVGSCWVSRFEVQALTEFVLDWCKETQTYLEPYC